MNFNPRSVALLAVTLIVLVHTEPTQAGYLTGFSGNSKEETSNLLGKVTENFAVLDRLTGASTASDVFGTGLAGFDSLLIAGSGSAAFDTSARYLYLYQDVISPSSSLTFTHDGISNQGQPLGITSYGQWNLFLADDGGIVSTANDFGVDGVAFAINAPANIGVTMPSVSASGPTGNLGAGTITVTATSLFDQFSPGLLGGRIENIYGFTTNSAPQFLTFTSTTSESGGTVPVPTPEPASIVLFSAGAVGWLAYHRLRKSRSHSGTT
jgi:hypothetical protein